MGFGDPVGNRQASGGWWRLLAGVVGVVAATLGFGFYLPLRQGNQLLTAEYTQARQANATLEQELATAKAALTALQNERDSLHAFKTSHEDSISAQQVRISQTVASLPSAVQTAASAGKLALIEVPKALHVNVLEATLFTPPGDGLTKTGRSLLCQVITQAQRQGLTQVGVRTFAPSTRTNPSESRWASAERLASGVADTLTSKCGLAAAQVNIGSSLQVPGGPRLRLELNAPN